MDARYLLAVPIYRQTKSGGVMDVWRQITAVICRVPQVEIRKREVITRGIDVWSEPVPATARRSQILCPRIDAKWSLAGRIARFEVHILLSAKYMETQIIKRN